MALYDPPHADRPGQLQDGFGRRFSYLRLSLTERCNFRCQYCLPNGFAPQKDRPAELSRDELRRAVQAFADLGLWKLRLTGGEPTVRTDFEAIVRDMHRLEGIRRIAMTTNGYRLARSAESWREAGVDAVNVSVDTLDPDRFAEVTRKPLLPEVLAGIDRALDAGFDAVKVNSVLLSDPDEAEWDRILAFVATRPVSWRFIELMRTNDNAAFHARQATPGRVVREKLENGGWRAVPRDPGSGPSVDFAHSDYAGRIGLIAPYEHGFCDSCNRLRLSSRGRLHLCLFGNEGLDLRDLLQNDESRDELVARIVAAMPAKMPGHRLRDGDSGATPHLASIGG